MTRLATRRRFLVGGGRGMLFTLGLPFLECFLNANGTALANGAPLPVRFGTWFWGLGMDRQIFVPQKTGANFDLPLELEALRPVRQHVNVLTNFNVPTDGRPNLCHYTGWVALRCGQAPTGRTQVPAESLDVTIADAIGDGTRFRSLEMAATGNPLHSYSLRSADAVNPPEISAVDLYRRIFGPEFRDPNSPDFVADPGLLARRSVISAVMEDVADLEKKLGASDRARLDQYLTSLRGLERRIVLGLERPPPADACRVPRPVDRDVVVGLDTELVAHRHTLMTDLLVMALACNQTRVFNMVYSDSNSTLVKRGFASTHHTVTHEEPVDPALGYQVMNSWFVKRSMEAWAYFVGALASVPEGDGSLLDRTLVFAHSDQELAKTHSISGIPMMTAGCAGGRVKTGLHVDGKGDVGSRVGLTMLRAMGLPQTAWGAGSMTTDRDIGDILA